MATGTPGHWRATKKYARLLMTINRPQFVQNHTAPTLANVGIMVRRPSAHGRHLHPSCRFCAVDTGNPWAVDLSEPQNAAQSVKLMSLGYVVLTSVDRDDLPDGGAQHYADCIRAIKTLNRILRKH